MSEMKDFLERMADKYPEIMDIRKFPTQDDIIDYLDMKGELTEPVDIDIPDFADGGRVKYQTGSEYNELQTTIARPAPFIESAGAGFLTALEPILRPGAAVKTDLFAPSVADQNKLQQQALQQAATSAGLGQLTFGGPEGTLSDVGTGTGISTFEPFLNEAQRLAGAVGPQGQVTSAGLTAARDPFMSPFQQQVIDATKASFEQQRAKDRQSFADAAFGANAFGGARQGVQEGVYDAETALGLANLEAQLLQQGFAQAEQGRLGAMANQQAMAAQVPQLETAEMTQLQQLGTGQQALQQAGLDAAATAAREKAYESQQRFGFFGQQLAPFSQGFGAQSAFTTTTQPPPNTLNTILGVGTMAGGLLGGLGSFMGGMG